MTALLLAAACSFTAIATGLGKGTAVEFIFAGKGSDRDYESLFLLEESVGDFCDRLERAGFPRGRPIDTRNCRLWPVGCTLKIEPPIGQFIDINYTNGFKAASPVYTGGTRLQNGICEASTNMPLAAFSTYSLAQSPIVFNDDYQQGVVYGAFTAREALEKGKRYKFTISTDTNSLPKSLQLVARPNEAEKLLQTLRRESATHELDVLLSFAPEMTVEEAETVARAVSIIDSPHVKINGVGNIFYRSFLPLEKWRDRKERLVQPFELTIGNPDRLVFISEDWSGESLDPKLTPIEISFDEVAKHERTDTCLIYAEKTTTVGRLVESMRKFKSSTIRNWYVFSGK